MPLIYVQIHAYTYIYQRIHTYTYIYMKIRMLNDKVWIVVRCQCPAVTRTRCRPAPDTDWDCQWAARWPLTGHRSPAASGPGRLGGGWACHWPCCRDAGGLPLSVTGRPPWRRTNEWKNWAYQADPILWQCQLSSTGFCNYYVKQLKKIKLSQLDRHTWSSGRLWRLLLVCHGFETS